MHVLISSSVFICFFSSINALQLGGEIICITGFERVKFDMQVGALEEAVNYGRMELAKFFELPVFEDLVKVAFYQFKLFFFF